VQEGDGEWVSLDSEIIMKNGEPIGTQTPTGHYVLLDTRFEPPPGITLSLQLSGGQERCLRGKLKLTLN